ncbi:MAG: alpha/beta hydrolase [Cyclobacteriaceae bacterium]|nr:alpha/beta hydrolase [Cyclobacteriaceae bacterium]
MITEAVKPKAVLTFAHGAGAGMQHSFMESMAEALKQQSITTVRFNFPYMENKKGRPDSPAIAHKTIEVVIDETRKRYPKLPVFVSGKSFGGRMSSQKISKECPEFVKGIIFFGFPLHPAGAPAIDRAEHLSLIKIPMLFLQGTKDALAEMELLEPVVKKLKTAVLKKFEGADHSFKVKSKILIEPLAEEASQWIDKHYK